MNQKLPQPTNENAENPLNGANGVSKTCQLSSTETMRTLLDQALEDIAYINRVHPKTGQKKAELLKEASEMIRQARKFMEKSLTHEKRDQSIKLKLEAFLNNKKVDNESIKLGAKPVQFQIFTNLEYHEAKGDFSNDLLNQKEGYITFFIKMENGDVSQCHVPEEATDEQIIAAAKQSKHEIYQNISAKYEGSK